MKSREIKRAKRNDLKYRINTHLTDKFVQALPTVLCRGRNAGHTESMLAAAEATGATVVFAIHAQTLPYRKRYPSVRFETLLTMREGYNGEAPVLFDNSAWDLMARTMLTGADMLREAAQEMGAD